MSDTTWILGAGDPEMEAVADLLRESGQAAIYATLEGSRVSPRDAYRADATTWPVGPLILVECGPADPLRAGGVVARCDHHNPGDSGWGAPPAEFFEASSLGQVVSLLADGNVLPPSWWRADIDPAAVAWSRATRDGLTRLGFDPASRQWVVGQGAEWLVVPAALAMIAAADHCLGAAYAGQCPGVDPEELFQARAAARGAWLSRGRGQGRDEARAEIARAYFGRSPEALDVGETGDWGPTDECTGECPPGAHLAHSEQPWATERWTAAVRHATETTRALLRSGGLPVVDLGGVFVLDLREVGTLPELPTALSLEGLCALYRMQSPPGKPGPAKVGIIGAGLGTAPGPEPVEAFLAAAREGCVAGTHVVTGPPGAPNAPYGDSARGYAGAYERGAP